MLMSRLRRPIRPLLLLNSILDIFAAVTKKRVFVVEGRTLGMTKKRVFSVSLSLMLAIVSVEIAGSCCAVECKLRL